MATAPPDFKRDVRQYRSHLEARETYRTAPERGKGRAKPVERGSDCDGYRLPTAAELDHVRRIAGYIRFSLPYNFADHLWWVRGFLDAFAYGRGRKDTPKEEVKRRCSIARQLAFERCSFRDLQHKLFLPGPAAEILLDYGLQRVPDHWWRNPEGSPDDCLMTSDPVEGEDAEGPVVTEPDWFDCDGDDSGLEAAMNFFQETSQN